MELRLHRLRILREVAHHGGVNAAALATHYSPSAVSQQMAALERDVGAPVLERRGRHVVLTEVGQVLLHHAEILLAAERDARSAVEHVRDLVAVELTVGVFSTVAAGLVPQVVTDLGRRRPEIRVRTRETDPDEAGMQLAHGHLDLAFLIDYPDATEPWTAGLALVPVMDDRLHVAAATGQLAPGTIRLADLADHDWIISGPQSYYGRAVRAACRDAGFEVRTTHEVDGQATALAMVAAGLGVTLVSDLGRTFLPGDGITLHRVSRPLRRRILLARHERADSPAMQAFLSSTARAVAALELADQD
ncbi:HTH-type transcriptional regulator GltC [Nocardioides dokdonensis FR1436]|uniref:HTH-type transcriptional regulator GltC n=1 Tax=Nocardioides dokdonensis FR1436 TaxID=1300347 RepID=A0A1A9GKM8_9ACTN|nr:LysR family transcriptional regulator [Nocardioides dokdonensis]ANH38230.1 HTH-type transcriptional regulator GltC [Nocardioides dokdonensis FR1436]